VQFSFLDTVDKCNSGAVAARSIQGLGSRMTPISATILVRYLRNQKRVAVHIECFLSSLLLSCRRASCRSGSWSERYCGIMIVCEVRSEIPRASSLRGCISKRPVSVLHRTRGCGGTTHRFQTRRHVVFLRSVPLLSSRQSRSRCCIRHRSQTHNTKRLLQPAPKN